VSIPPISKFLNICNIKGTYEKVEDEEEEVYETVNML
jgi:hypothetical protein